MSKPIDDIDDTREGHWMQLSSGGRFWPGDPRSGEVFIEDIAAGLATNARYAGQYRADIIRAGKFYSVAEHCVHLADYAYLSDGQPSDVCLAVLLHDAAEAYIRDLPRAVKHSAGDTYARMEGRVQAAIERRYNIALVAWKHQNYIKKLDRRIVPLEKAAFMNATDSSWAFDQFEPLPGIRIEMWPPAKAYDRFLKAARLFGVTS